MAFTQVLLFLPLVLTSSTIISDDVKSLIYTLQTKYCGRHLCSPDTSYTPPICGVQDPGRSGRTTIGVENTTAENYTSDPSNEFNTETSPELTTIISETHTSESPVESGHILNQLQRCEPCHRCSCDDSCVIFGDCCVDKGIGGKYFFDCELVETYDNGINSGFFLIVTKCQKDAPNYTEDLAEKCEHGKLGYVQDGRLVTAPHPFNTSVTFRNKYCAACYDVNNYTSWDVYISCDEDIDSSNYTNINSLIRSAKDLNCLVTTNIKKGGHARSCAMDSNMVSTCNVTGLWREYNKSIEEACHSYYNPTLNNYKNIFCHLCNGRPEQELKCPSVCEIYLLKPVVVMPFSALLNFENSDAEVVASPKGQRGSYQAIKRFGDQTHAQCRDRDIYDSYSKKCRERYCPLSESNDTATCIQLVSDEHLILTTWNVTLLYKEGITILPFIPFNFLNPLGNYFHNNYQKILSECGFVVHDMRDTPYARIKNADSLVVDEGHLQFTLLLLPNYTIASSRECLAALKSVTLNTTHEGKPLQVEVHPFTTHRHVQDKLALLPYVFGFGYAFEMNLDMLLSINVPLAFNVTCSMAAFDSREVSNVNNSVFIHGDTKLNEHEYFLSNYGTYFICLDAVLRRREEMVAQVPTNISQTFLASTITTGVCLSLSLLFLLLTLSVYILIKELHTIPGLNLILLSSSLFLAQVFYLFGAGTVTTPIICTVIGVLIHYFWLVSFAWMNICCLHMFRVFTKLFSSLHLADDKVCLMIKYSVCAYGVPLVIVTMTLTITYIQSGYTNVGYGGPALCFVTSGLVSAVSFGVPACLTVVINVVLFLWTMTSLRFRNKENQTLGKKQANDIITFFKLSTLTGLSWLFGFIGYLLQRVELMYVFTVLTAGQGVFIFFSFVVSRRIRKLIREKLRRLWLRNEKGHVNMEERSSAKDTSMSTSSKRMEIHF
ncbi:uncharacterized protein LOC124280053 [Haliotis rubra]|uniref:uncharacterized protein LOC124280053 n=1 Tax=Haliotis rubra TaxID=36100 RepID=UPI001EE51684|nr:uncharacterized protein LOC124280053 [Haliotis rubra]